jgi:hypothetical protein
MAIAYQVWWTFIILAIICTAYSWLTKDRNNYTDAIAGIFSVLLWFVTGISCLIGIQAESMAFTAGWAFWIFLIVGIIEGVIVFVKILDIIASRKNESHTPISILLAFEGVFSLLLCLFLSYLFCLIYLPQGRACCVLLITIT